MDDLQWIKDLALCEQKIEESGISEFAPGFDPGANLKSETTAFLQNLKNRFIAAVRTFNQLKGTTVGQIKIYGISKTEADFMLFRYGFKLILSMSEPGKITVSFNHFGGSYIPGQDANTSTSKQIMEDNLLIAKWGAFGKLRWTFKDLDIDEDYLVRHYISWFIRESAKQDI